MSQFCKSGEMMVRNVLRGSVGEKLDQLDLIADFEMGIDKISFAAEPGVEDMKDFWMWEVDGRATGTEFTLVIKDTSERIRIDTTEETSWADIMIEDHFTFG